MTGNDNVSRRRFLQAAGGAASAVALAGCSGDGGGGTTAPGDDETTTEVTTQPPTDTPEETTTRSVQQDMSKTYRLVNSTVTTLDPIALTDEASLFLGHNLYDALTHYPNGMTFTENLLATGFEEANNGTELTFTLKEGVTFTTSDGAPGAVSEFDGKELTASDMVYSLNRLAESKNSKRAGFLLGDLGVAHETDDDGNYVPGSLQVSADGDYTLKMTLSQPFHATLEMLAYDVFACIPEGLVGDIEGYDGAISQSKLAKEAPVSSGPFTFAKWSQSEEAEIAARKQSNYHGPGPFIGGVNWAIIEKTDPAYTYATLNKNADHPSVPNAKYDPNKVSIEGTDDFGREYGTYGPLANGMTVPYYKVAEVVTYYLALHQQNVPKPVRKAFAHVVNQDEIVNTILKGPGNAAVHLVPPMIFPGGAPGYAEHAKKYPYGRRSSNIQKAKSIMEEAGYGPNNKFEVTFTTYQSDFFKQVAGIIRDKAASAHMTLNLKPTNFSTMIEQGTKGKLEIYTLGWGMDYPAPDNFLQIVYPPNTDTSKSAPMAYVDWKGTEASQSFMDAWEKFENNPGASESAKQKRNEAYITMEEAIWEDVVLVNVLHPITEHMKYPWVNKPRVGGAGSASQKDNVVVIEDDDRRP